MAKYYTESETKSFFENQKKLGKVAEKTAIEYLRSIGITAKDMSEDEEYQALDTDLLVQYPDGTERTIEVKSCSYIGKSDNYYMGEPAHNIFAEIAQSQSLGYLFGSTADDIWYFDNINGIFWVFRLEHLQEYVRTTKRLKKQHIDISNTEGFLVPLKDFMSRYPVKSIVVPGNYKQSTYRRDGTYWDETSAF